MRSHIVGPNVGSNLATERTVVGPVLGMSYEEMQELASTILVMVPHRKSQGVAAGLFINAGHWARFALAYGAIEDEHQGFVEVTRANMCRHFLDYAKDNPSIDKLVMIDADENVPWDAPFRLAKWDVPVVSGIICNFSDARGAYACVQFKDKYGVTRFPSHLHTREIPGRGLKEAESLGTGLICIKKNVIEAIYASGGHPFKIPEDIRDSCFETGVLKQGEDIAFSHQCDALGFKRYVDFSVRGTHYKTLPIEWPKNAVNYEVTPDEWSVSEKDFAHG